ncbi:MAG: FkbM family methyltransferase [Okeania sp. SIO3I5]|uniref:FkbM family methyltransferase n=1 Tax=Okeania sp. SIO3I5 TaxID=2607805 RepID=UPI0013BAE826|nr:FkbM family methyltransferase [Okeania sp. SIO3I5]NEQ35834.1 FkbM family methyltransferase [Okeania sp. SIO3I5]
MNLTKNLLVPDYIYSARVDVADIPFFEEAFYQDLEFYTEDIKSTSDRFNYGLRIGYGYMNMIKKNLYSLPEKYTIKSLGDKGFDWRFVPELINKYDVKYSICAGAGTNITFETSFAQEFPDINITLLDPSPHSVKHIERIKLPSNLKFLPVGFSNKDEILKFHKPSTHGAGSLSTLNLQPSDTFFELPVKRILTILNEQNIEAKNLCYLKFDIEGSEHAVIDDIIKSKLRPAHIAFEFDQPVPPWTMEKTLKKLIKYGYAIVDIWGLNVLAIDKLLIT